MRARPIKFKSSLWLKWTVLLASWIFSFLVLIIVTKNNELNTLYNNAMSHGPELGLPKNQIGSLSYTRWDPKENGRPIYSIYFKNLLTENSQLGIFKTALHKVVKIQGLELKFYRYNSPPDISSLTEDTIANVRALLKEIIRKLTSPESRWRVNNIYLGNISEVLINNFNYEVFHDDYLFFAIQSKRAMTSYKKSQLALRGHVIITAADGSTLESNYIKWDIENQRFTVNGIYVLNRNGVKTIGKDICVDTQLNLARAQQAKYEQKEAERCFAKLQ